MTAPYERFCKNRVAADRSGLRWKGGLGDAAHNKLHGDFRSENSRAPRSVMNEAQLAHSNELPCSLNTSLGYPGILVRGLLSMTARARHHRTVLGDYGQ